MRIRYIRGPKPFVSPPPTRACPVPRWAVIDLRRIDNSIAHAPIYLKERRDVGEHTHDDRSQAMGRAIEEFNRIELAHQTDGSLEAYVEV